MRTAIATAAALAVLALATTANARTARTTPTGVICPRPSVHWHHTHHRTPRCTRVTTKPLVPNHRAPHRFHLPETTR